MKLHTIKNTSKEIVSALLSMDVGWSNEPVGKRGISHFLEHAVFLGSNEHPDPDKEVGKYGAMLDGETMADRTIFYFTSLEEDAEDILDILLSLVFHPSFPEDKVRKEKESKIVPAVVKESDYRPWELAYEWARNLIFDWDFRYSMGTEEELNALNTNDLREWHRRYYQGGNATLLTDSPINIPDIKIPKGSEVPERQRIEWKEKEMIINKGIDNVEIVFAFPIEKYDLRAHLLSTILGNYPTSPFWKAFHRDAYMVESRVEWHWRGGFFLYAGANKNVDEIQRKFIDFIKGLCVSREDVEIAKKALTLEILKNMKSKFNLEYLLHIAPELKFADIDEIIRAIDNISHAEMKNYAAEILNDENIRVVVVE